MIRTLRLNCARMRSASCRTLQASSLLPRTGKRLRLFKHRYVSGTFGFMNYHQAHQLLRASDPRMAALIARSRRYEIGPAVSIRPFDALAESIAYQQLNGKAAASIWNRVRALYPKRKRLDPAKVLATPNKTLRPAGLSRGKIAAI